MTLSKRLAVYVPMGVENGVDNSNKELAYIVSRMSSAFGGCTVTKAEGYWMDDKGELVKDDIAIAYSYIDADGWDDLGVENMAEMLAIHVRGALAQDCVSVEIGSELHII